MLINIPLPINSDRLNQQDQSLSLAGMTWSDFEKFIAEEYSGYRINYFKGVITIVSPSKNHERIAEVIGDLVKAYCRKHNLLYFSLGSTTLKHPPLVGKEPDVSFAFNIDKNIPDLATGSPHLILYKMYLTKVILYNLFSKSNRISLI